MHSVTSNAVATNLGMQYDDNDLVDITSQVTKFLGVTTVYARRKNNLVYLYIGGVYSGSPTTSSQSMLKGLPSKYKPKIEQNGFAFMGYNSNQRAVTGRGGVTIDGDITLGETSWNNGTQIRTCFIYMTD